jgi:hypothetical protein
VGKAIRNSGISREEIFVTGSDLLIDGGVIAAMRMGRLG